MPNVSPHAGKPPEPSMLVNVARLVTAYYSQRPDPSVREQRVAFGTSGHRGSALKSAFNEAHIVTITEAICRYRKGEGIDGPLFLGMDTHALSEPAFATALEVLAANSVEVMLDSARGYTPTPAVSLAILDYNRGRREHLADGIVITPSHNPPEDGGFKYNPPSGGPADTSITKSVEDQANALLGEDWQAIKRVPFERALGMSTTHRHDYISAYAAELASIIDMEVLRGAKLRIGVDPMGGAAVAYWESIATQHRLDITVVNDAVDASFRFMRVDWDGKIRMDCSSPYAMAGLIALRDRFDVAFGNDTDSDRHGIVTKSSGLLNPNHFLAVSIEYLFRSRQHWRADAGVGKTVVSSAIIDKVVQRLGRKLFEVPVGFKWFVDGLIGGTLGFGGEESAGASFLRRDGSVWTTDKDGLIMGLLAAEMTAARGRDPGEIYADLTHELGAPIYERIDAPASTGQKATLQKLTPQQLTTNELAGEPIRTVLTNAPGNGAAIGGLKVCTDNGWFAARPSGTEDVYKLYAESFRDADHLRCIQDEARELISKVFRDAGVE